MAEAAPVFEHKSYALDDEGKFVRRADAPALKDDDHEARFAEEESLVEGVVGFVQAKMRCVAPPSPSVAAKGTHIS